MLHIPSLNSIRWKLPATYAGIAMLTTLALGVALLMPLRSYYASREQEYLQRNASAIAQALPPLMEIQSQPVVNLQEQIRFLALISQTRVRLIGADQQVIADEKGSDSYGVTSVSVASAPIPNSFSILIGESPSDRTQSAANMSRPDTITQAYPAAAPAMPTNPDEKFSIPMQGATAEQQPPVDRLRFFYATSPQAVGGMAYQVSGPEAGRTDTVVAVMPLVSSMYGFELQADGGSMMERSDQIYRQVIMDQAGKPLGWVELSQGPAYGREIVTNVARGWLIASLIAVLVAGSAGWWISQRMTAPLLTLTTVTQEMAAGDLSARVDLHQKDEFGSLGRSFNEMAEQVERTVLTLRRFVADAAHELNTPLTALRTNLELASTTQGSEYLERAAGQIERIEQLTNNLLDLSRVESQPPEHPADVFDLRSLTQQTVELFASRAEQKGINLMLDLQEGPLPLTGWAAQLDRAISNLIENALKFTPPGGQVTIGLRTENGQAVFWVEDTGIGIEPEDLEQLFNRFHRGRNAAAYPGSGLGLSIVRAVVAQHHGTVTAGSSQGRTRFTIVIPRSD